MMVVMACYLIGEMSIPEGSGMSKPVLSQEFERTIDGGFGQAGCVGACLFINFNGRKMSPRVM
ncbi:hypothetical protein ARNL5_01804 [Anaerolineae bacterium]|nr:hypothetical protein ARNL5_01804 [Anaerolineae bacterium]